MHMCNRSDAVRRHAGPERASRLARMHVSPGTLGEALTVEPLADLAMCSPRRGWHAEGCATHPYHRAGAARPLRAPLAARTARSNPHLSGGLSQAHVPSRLFRTRTSAGGPSPRHGRWAAGFDSPAGRGCLCVARSHLIGAPRPPWLPKSPEAHVVVSPSIPAFSPWYLTVAGVAPATSHARSGCSHHSIGFARHGLGRHGHQLRLQQQRERRLLHAPRTRLRAR